MGAAHAWERAEHESIDRRVSFDDLSRPGTDHHGEMGIRDSRFQSAQNGCGQDQVPKIIWTDEQDARMSPRRLLCQPPGAARSYGSIQTYKQKQYSPG